MGGAVDLCLLLVTEFAVDQAEVVVGHGVFAVFHERLGKLRSRGPQGGCAGVGGRRTTKLTGPIVEREPKQVPYFVVAAEVEFAIDHLLRAALQDASEVGLCFFQPTLLAVDLAGEPAHRPWGSGWIFVRGGSTDGLGSFIKAALSEVDAGEVQRAVVATELFNFGESGLGLSQFCLALEQEADAVVVPPLPLGDLSWLWCRGQWLTASHCKRHRVFGEREDRQLVDVVLPLHVAPQGVVPRALLASDPLHVFRVKLAVVEFDPCGDRSCHVLWQPEPIVHRGAGAWGNLIVVERDKNVLSVAAVDAVAVAVEHEHVDEVRPAVDLVARLGIDAAAAADHLAIAFECDVEPNLVGVNGALRKQVPERQRANHGLQQVGAARFEHRHLWTQRRSQRCVDRRALADPEEIHPHTALEKLPMSLHDLWPVVEPGEARVGRREEVVVDL